ncbi:MAG: sulfatase-like hydrolase/transferase, partial [Armatimonadetes bacterium]|nr:sulfatase-like hydrolase/transferase [Armatimonadota bacterium]NDK16971.1 sulfatase-like hydrolase/transferase [Armatimonadota bacterium]
MNVIVIVADSLRYDHVGCCGNTWIETPRLDALAKESMLFDNAYVEGMPTLPCRTAFFTGR